METLVHSLITSKLDSCNVLFMRMTKKNLSKLQLLQNAALRCVLDIPPHSPLSHHYMELHWLHVEKRIYFKYITVIFKCLNNVAPKQLSSTLKLRCPFDMLLDTNNFVPSSSWGKRSFSYLAPRLWNALPVEMRIITNIERFKSTLKQFLFTDFRAYLRELDPYTSTALMHGGEHADDDFLINYIFY